MYFKEFLFFLCYPLQNLTYLLYSFLFNCAYTALNFAGPFLPSDDFKMLDRHIVLHPVLFDTQFVFLNSCVKLCMHICFFFFNISHIFQYLKDKFIWSLSSVVKFVSIYLRRYWKADLGQLNLLSIWDLTCTSFILLPILLHRIYKLTRQVLKYNKKNN